MSYYKNSRPHQGSSSGVPSQLYGSSGHHPPTPQQNLIGSDDFPQSYPDAGSYSHQPQQPPHRAQGYQFTDPSNRANSLEESSVVEGYPLKQHGDTGSYYQPQLQPPLPQRAAPLPPQYASSHQYNSLHQPENNSSTQSNRSLDNYRQGQPPVLGGPQAQEHLRYEEAILPENRASGGWGHTTPLYKERQPSASASFQPPSQRYSAPGWDGQDESLAYPVHYQHGNTSEATPPADQPPKIAPSAHPGHCAQMEDEPVRMNPDVYAPSYTLPSRQPMVQPQPPLAPQKPPPMPPQSSAYLQASQPKPPQQPPILYNPSLAPKPPDGYPSRQPNTSPVGRHLPTPETEKSRCCCTIL